MIGYLRGQIVSREAKSIILDVAGVGYDLHVSPLLAERSTVGQALTCFVHTHVREDQITLFGFNTQEDKQLFLLLLSVSGIGPKTALDLMSVPAQDLMAALASGDLAFLTSCPGIGKKTAERMALELKDKVTHIALPTGSLGAPGTHASLVERNFGDIIAALESLGYEKRHIQVVLSRYLEEHSADTESEELIIKYCLQHL